MSFIALVLLTCLCGTSGAQFWLLAITHHARVHHNFLCSSGGLATPDDTTALLQLKSTWTLKVL